MTWYYDKIKNGGMYLKNGKSAEKSAKNGKKGKTEGEKNNPQDLDHHEYKHLVPAPKTQKRGFRQLRREFREAVEHKNEKRAWDIAKLYNQRWNER